MERKHRSGCGVFKKGTEEQSLNIFMGKAQTLPIFHRVVRVSPPRLLDESQKSENHKSPAVSCNCGTSVYVI